MPIASVKAIKSRLRRAEKSREKRQKDLHNHLILNFPTAKLEKHVEDMISGAIAAKKRAVTVFLYMDTLWGMDTIDELERRFEAEAVIDNDTLTRIALLNLKKGGALASCYTAHAVTERVSCGGVATLRHGIKFSW